MMSPRAKQFLVFHCFAAAAFGGYAAFFLLFHGVMGASVAIFSFLPALAIAWLQGIKRGIIAAILANILTFGLHLHTGGCSWDAGSLAQLLPGFTAVVLIAVVVGYLRELRERVRRDLAERKRIEAELRASEERFKTIFESSYDALMLLDEEGFFECNPRTLELFGFESKEAFTRVHPAEISPPKQPDGTESFPAAQARIGAAFQTGSNRFEWVHRRSDGTDFPAEVLLSAFTLDGKRVLQATVRDVTGYRDLLEKLRKKNTEILEYTEMVTHDLKKPLSVMKTVYSLLKSGAYGELNGDGPEVLSTGNEAIGYMQEMLDDLLVLAKLEAGGNPLARQKIRCESVVEEVLVRLKYQIMEKNIAVKKNGLYIEIDADPKALAAILMNLVGNAANYIGDVADPRIDITAEYLDSHARISVKDNGMGIPEQSQAALFQKFKRGANVSGINGTGLGLSIVKAMVSAHGGKIWFESKVGEGTAFHFTLD